MRATLISLLERVQPQDEQERRDWEWMKKCAVELAEPFSRAQATAHFTGSAVVVSPDGAQVCLVNHARLKRWLQPGGHAAGEDGGDLLRTALREAREETALEVSVHPVAPLPLDVDAHLIPARNDEPAHHHLDVRFLLVAKDPSALRHDPNESTGSKWLSWDEALKVTTEPAFLRMLQKARTVFAEP
jgi:8-oxo-dGTP pyrophosphatase MutT (NUDIX family)